MKKTLCCLFVLLFALAGCLEVDGQDITIRYDAAADRIDMHFVHRGLFAEGGSGSDKDPLAKAVRDLAEVRASGEVVFWCNWPLTFDLTRDYPAPAKAMLAHGGEPTDTTATPSTVQVLGEQLTREIQRAPSYRFFWDNELCLVREPELTRFSFGVRGDGELRIKKASDGLWHPALLNKLREAGEVIEDGLPDQELVRRFEAFQKRDAVLPPKVAEMRGAAKAGREGEKKVGDGK